MYFDDFLLRTQNNIFVRQYPFIFRFHFFIVITNLLTKSAHFRSRMLPDKYITENLNGTVYW